MIPVRYIRDWLSGSPVNGYNQWVEIKALNATGTNLALGSPVTASSGGNPALITDGVVTTSPYYSSGPGPQWVRVDLGAIRTDISSLTVWHYFGDGRTFHGSKTEISIDGVNWLPLFDAVVSGEYTETVTGHAVPLSTDLSLAHGGTFPFGIVGTDGYFLPSTLPERAASVPMYNQATARSAGGVAYGYDPVHVERSLDLHWPRMSDFDAMRLTEFFTAVNGMVSDFTVFDASGAAGYVARFATPRLDIVDRAYGVKEVSLSLRGAL
jgi:hypothetical protein